MAPGVARKRAVAERSEATAAAGKRRRSDPGSDAGGDGGPVAVKLEEDNEEGPLPVVVVDTVANGAGDPGRPDDAELRRRFLAALSEPRARAAGVSNGQLKAAFGAALYPRLAPVINALTQEDRLAMSQVPGSGELVYRLESPERAARFAGLDRAARMVYHVVEQAGDTGVWTKDVRLRTGVQQQALNKIFRALEHRRLVKPVKSVAAKAKKLYMLYDLVPSKELTGGVWYSDLEFDHEFISELRNFILHCVRRLNGGRGVTVAEVQQTLVEKKVCKIDLAVEEMEQLVETLVYDYLIEEAGHNDQGEALYLPAKRVSTICEFKWWDALLPDFHFRQIVFEDGVTLPPHEHHYQT